MEHPREPQSLSQVLGAPETCTVQPPCPWGNHVNRMRVKGTMLLMLPGGRDKCTGSPSHPQQGLVPFAFLCGLGLVSVHRGSSKRAHHSPSPTAGAQSTPVVCSVHLLPMGTWEMRGRVGTPMFLTATFKELEHCGLCPFALEVTIL